MAYTTGTASNYLDLLSIVATFAAANGWTINEQTSTTLAMTGEGPAGLDEIQVQIRAYESSATGYYNWQLYGSIAYRAEKAVNEQPLQSDQQANHYLTLWNDAIPYWIYADASKIIIAAKVSTRYPMAYLGFIEPFGTSGQYPYPLYVGGNSEGSTYLWSSSYLTNFWAGNTYRAGLLWLPTGQWGIVDNPLTSNVIAAPNLQVRRLYENGASVTLSAEDGSYMLEPIYFIDYHRDALYGQLGGVYGVSGYNNSAENIITIGGVNYIVFPDVYRTGYANYCAMRLG